MYSDAKKIHLIEKLLQTADEAKWAEVEKVLDNRLADEERKTTLSDFAGTLDEEDAEIMKKSLEWQRQIHPDDWR